MVYKSKKLLIWIMCFIVVAFAVSGCGSAANRIEDLENKYLESQEEKDLVTLCSWLMFTDSYEKKIQYFRKAINMDEETFEQQYNVANNSIESYDAYQEMIVEYMFAYIYTKRYDELKEIFPELFHKMIECNAILELDEHILQGKKLTEEEYQPFLNLLEEYEPEYIEPKMETRTQLLEKQTYMDTRAHIYLSLGNQEQYEYWSQKAMEYNQWWISVLKEKNDSHS